MSTSSYDLYSEFDIEMHKQHFTDYLEVLIEADGHIVYAVPSHIQKAILLACRKLRITPEQLNDLCPPEYYADFDTWVLRQTNAIMVWNNFFKGESPTIQQRNSLRKLKLAGLYHGPLP